MLFLSFFAKELNGGLFGLVSYICIYNNIIVITVLCQCLQSFKRIWILRRWTWHGKIDWIVLLRLSCSWSITWSQFLTFFLLSFDFCQFCVVIRFFHSRHNGQWPPTSKDFYTRSYPLHSFSYLNSWERASISFFNVEC